MRGKAFGAVVLGAVLFAPTTAQAWECSVDLDKCVAVDTDLDGDVDEEVCGPSAAGVMGEAVRWTFDIHNTGPNTLGSCVLTDPTLGINLPVGNIEVSGRRIISTIDATCMSASISNTATVTCTQCAGLTEGPFVDSDSATLTCEPPPPPEEFGCLTRTPGYWGNHPDVTALFLPVTSCGLLLDETGAMTTGSATEDICYGGKDRKASGNSPQEMQLIRQCAAAQINLAATDYLGGSCEAEFPGIEATVAACCESLCAWDPSKADIVASGCIEMLDEFNKSTDWDLDETALCPNPALGTSAPCRANSQYCRASRNNGWVNPR